MSDFSFPILAEVDFGHQQTMLPLPIGVKTRLDCEKLELEILETAVTLKAHR